MPRVRRRGLARLWDITDAEWAWVNDSPLTDEQRLTMAYFSWAERRAEVWERCKSSVLERWVREHPGTRPMQWWVYDSPDAHKLEVDPPYVIGMRVHPAVAILQDAETQLAYLHRHGLLLDGEYAAAVG